MLLGNFNPYTENLKFPKVTKSLATSKKILILLIKNLKKKEIIILSMNSSKQEKKVISLNFQILKNGEGEKIRKDFHKKRNFLFISLI